MFADEHYWIWGPTTPQFSFDDIKVHRKMILASMFTFWTAYMSFRIKLIKVLAVYKLCN